jgi:hypothetical protein
LKEQNAEGGGAAELSAPPYEDKFSHKIKIQSKDDSDSDSVSDEKGQEDTPAHKVTGAMSLGLPPWAKRLPTLAKSPLQAALQEACSQGEETAGFRFYPVFERPDANNPGKQQRFQEKITFKTVKEVKQACTMYGSTAPFTQGLLQSVVGDTAMPPDD